MAIKVAATVATLAVMAMMGWVLATGILRLGPPKAPSHTLAIKQIRSLCSRHIPRPFSEMDSRPELLAQVQAQCDGKAACALDSGDWVPGYDPDPACSREYAVRYACHRAQAAPQARAGVADTAFLYEGQRASLRCPLP